MAAGRGCRVYIDALVAARCLKVKVARIRRIATTELGDRVMREQERVMLALPAAAIERR